MSDENLTQEPSEVALQPDSGFVANHVTPEEGIDSVAADLASELLQDLSDENRGGLNTKPQESEESTDEEETPVVEGNDDETPDIEAEDDVEGDDEPTESTGETWDVDYDDVKDARLPIKINGEVKMMDFGEIQNQLARSEAASKKSREANQQLEELDTIRNKLAEEEAAIKRQADAVKMSDEVAVRVNYIRQMEAQLKKAVEDNDSHNATLLRERINAVSAEANQIHQQVIAAEQEVKNKHLATQQKILVDRGYGDMINDNYISYAKEQLSEDGLKAVNDDATLAIILDKARKWDESQSKGQTRKLKKKTKTLNAGTGNIQSTKSKEEKELQQRFATGKASKAEAEDALLGFAKDFLS